jgi:CheY-like chemotaxis protein
MAARDGPPRRRVLMVNDDTRPAECVRALLTDTGYDTTLASDGNAGLDVLAPWPADLVDTIGRLLDRESAA